jgi:hypothetical protein
MIIEIDNYGCITFNNKNIDANKFGNIIKFLNNRLTEIMKYFEKLNNK